MSDPVPDPPAPEDLADFPVFVLTPDVVVVRIHRSADHPLFYGGVSRHDGRFDPPPGVDTFGTLYAADGDEGAFAETLGRHGRPIAEFEIALRATAALQVRSDIRLADFTDRTVLGRFKLSGAASAGGDEATIRACQRWADALHQAGFGGVRYRARNDPSLRSTSYAVFSRPGQDDRKTGPLVLVDGGMVSMSMARKMARKFGFVINP